MNELLLPIITGTLLIVAISVVATRVVVKKRTKDQLRSRVADFIPLAKKAVATPAAKTEADQVQFIPTWLQTWIARRMELAGWNAEPTDLILGTVCLLAVSTSVLHLVLNLHLAFSLLISLILAALPATILAMQANRTRQKLAMQLPNALDLMVSVLRSGHSLPQSIKAAANEMPNPCGREFGEVLHRVNLGQPLPEALSYTVARYESFELDLLRRAFHIHSDVGGSLAELLEKTNSTLRERIKLKRHVEVLTAPSKLTSWIVAALPFVVAGGCFMLAPDYLSPLLSTRIGNALVAVALVLQLTGLLILRRMASYKV